MLISTWLCQINNCKKTLGAQENRNAEIAGAIGAAGCQGRDRAIDWVPRDSLDLPWLWGAGGAGRPQVSWGSTRRSRVLSRNKLQAWGRSKSTHHLPHQVLGVGYPQPPPSLVGQRCLPAHAWTTPLTLSTRTQPGVNAGPRTVV